MSNNKKQRIPNDPDELFKATESYAALIEIYPDNEDYLRYYAELLLASNMQTTATSILQRLYKSLDKHSPQQAKKLAQEFPQLGYVSGHSTQENNMDIFQCVHDAFGSLWLRLHQKKFKEGQTIYHQGDPDDTLTVILDGDVAGFIESSSGKPILLNLIDRLNFVGESCFLKPGPHPNKVIANSDCRIVKLPRKTLIKWLEDHPSTVKKINKNATFRHILRIVSSTPVLQDLPMDLRQYLAQKAIIEDFPAKKLLQKAGKPFSGVNIFIQGDVCYVRQTSSGKLQKLGDIAHGELIGDTTVVKNITSAADILSTSPVSLVHIPTSAFKAVVAAHPPFNDKLLRHAAEQRAQIMQMVAKG